VESVAQCLIFLLSGSAVWILAQRKPWSKWGYLLGLSSEPFWLYSAVKAQQWGVVALTVWFAYSWLTGIHNHILKGNNAQER
jgi:hypothetical protein